MGSFCRIKEINSRVFTGSCREVSIVIYFALMMLDTMIAASHEDSDLSFLKMLYPLAFIGMLGFTFVTLIIMTSVFVSLASCNVSCSFSLKPFMLMKMIYSVLLSRFVLIVALVALAMRSVYIRGLFVDVGFLFLTKFSCPMYTLPSADEILLTLRWNTTYEDSLIADLNLVCVAGDTVRENIRETHSMMLFVIFVMASSILASTSFVSGRSASVEVFSLAECVTLCFSIVE